MTLPRPLIKYCRECGQKVAYQQADPHDLRERAVCTACGTVHYENPINVVGTIPVWGEQILLCKRNIEPRWGTWTLPAGFMELGESTAQGAMRETLEEAGTDIELEGLFSVISTLRGNQVHLFYRARMLHPGFEPPPHETLEARLFHEHEIPWDELSFRTVRLTLEHFFADRRTGRFGVHDLVLGP